MPKFVIKRLARCFRSSPSSSRRSRPLSRRLIRPSAQEFRRLVRASSSSTGTTAERRCSVVERTWLNILKIAGSTSSGSAGPFGDMLF
jgi:hypothetical protein